LLVFLGAIAPLPREMLVLGDKALHFLVFAGLAWIGVRASACQRSRLVMTLAAMSAGSELIQAVWSATRSSSIVDVLVSVAGAAAGALVADLRGRSLVAAGCAVAVLGMGIDLGIASVREPIVGRLVSAAWARAAARGVSDRPWPFAAARPVLALDLPGLTSPVVTVDAATPAALAIAPGLWPGRRPGQAGTTIVLGHRNGPFRILGDIPIGSTIGVHTVDGHLIRYKVARREVVRWDHSGLHLDTPSEQLALVTCWPLDASGPTAWRLVVRADRIPA
jgi:sortase A